MTKQRPKLTAAKVRKIRAKAIEGATYGDIADEFKIHPTFARAIALGNAYQHVDGPRDKLRTKPRTNTTKQQASRNGTPLDFASLPIDDAARFLQALAHEWPKIREAFNTLDAIITGRVD
jgi:hypothetical protein